VNFPKNRFHLKHSVSLILPLIIFAGCAAGNDAANQTGQNGSPQVLAAISPSQTNATSPAVTPAPGSNPTGSPAPVVASGSPPVVNPAPTPAPVPVIAPAPTVTKNHEGRILPALPSITAPVLFNTPEADQILSAMQIMPKNSAWNEDISARPVHPDSDKMIANIGVGGSLAVNMDMGFIIVPPNYPTTTVKVTTYAAESDLGPVPLPPNLPIENWPLYGGALETVQTTGTGDRHAIMVDPVAQKFYELGETYKTTSGWTAAGAAHFSLNSNQLRPFEWTSTDAAGLPIFPAVVRYDELARGMVEHAIRFTIAKTRRAYIYPATHFASPITDPTVAAMGQRFRLKASANLQGLSPHALAVAKGLQKYGMIVADNGGNWRISVAPDARITGLSDLGRFKGSDFEVIQTTGEFEGLRAPVK
jgi:hypothetical protein